LREEKEIHIIKDKKEKEKEKDKKKKKKILCLFFDA
jgi:hypothetical protein